MKFLFYAYLFLISISIASCKYLILKKYHFNEKFNFTEKNHYVSFLKDKKGLDISRVIYPDADSYSILIGEMVSDGLMVYYGCLINDSTEMIKSPELKDNLSCAGRILTEIKNNSISSDKSLFVKSNFRQFKFKYFNDDRSFNINESNKKLKVILIYSFAGGTYFDRYYKDIQEYFIKHQADVDLYIITMDPVSRLL